MHQEQLQTNVPDHLVQTSIRPREAPDKVARAPSSPLRLEHFPSWTGSDAHYAHRSYHPQLDAPNGPNEFEFDNESNNSKFFIVNGSNVMTSLLLISFKDIKWLILPMKFLSKYRTALPAAQIPEFNLSIPKPFNEFVLKSN